MCWFPKTTLKFKSKLQTLVLLAPQNKPISLKPTRGHKEATWPLKSTKISTPSLRYSMICTKPISSHQESSSSRSLWEGCLSNSPKVTTLTIAAFLKEGMTISGKCISKSFPSEKVKKAATLKTSKQFSYKWCTQNLVNAPRSNRFLNVLGFLVNNKLLRANQKPLEPSTSVDILNTFYFYIRFTQVSSSYYVIIFQLISEQ